MNEEDRHTAHSRIVTIIGPMTRTELAGWFDETLPEAGTWTGNSTTNAGGFIAIVAAIATLCATGYWFSL